MYYIQNMKTGEAARPFSLPGTDGKTYTLDSFKDKKILVVIFSCNHCPYVQAYEDRMMALQKEFGGQGVQFVLINSNEDQNYPEDSFDEMVKRAKLKGYPFPYLRDESQEVAKAYQAERTPHIYVFDGDRKLVYTGKIDDNWQEPKRVKEQYLRDALAALVKDEKPKSPETFAIGCSIKWKR